MLRIFSRRRWLSSLLFCSTVFTSTSAMSSTQDFHTTLRIMSTSDVHGQMLNYDYYAGSEIAEQGLVKTAALIAQARAEVPYAVLVENGDLIQGSAFADYAVAEFPVATATHPIIMALNTLRYDIANLGNHEFNFGLDYLADAYRDAAFPVLASNLELSAAAPTAIKKRLVDIAWVRRDVKPNADAATAVPLKIAVIGVAPPQIMQWDQHHLNGKARVMPMLDSVRSKVTTARRQGADIVVLAAHTGMPKHTADPQDSEQTGWLLAGVDGVDAMLLGHQHEIFPGTYVYDQLAEVDSDTGRVRGVPTVQPGIYGSHLGIIDLELQFSTASGWQVRSSRSEARAVTATTAIDASLAQRLAPAHAATLAFMQQPVGSTAHNLSYKTARWQPSSAVQFVQRAQLWQAQQLLAAIDAEPLPLLSAAAPFDAAFSDDEAATEVAAGPLTRGAVGDLYRYPNTLDIVKLNGAQIKDWLERSAMAFVSEVTTSNSVAGSCWSFLNTDFPHYNFDTLLGVDYHIDITAQVGQRIRDLSYAGHPVRAEQWFYVATNNYRANGGGDFPHLDGSTTVLRGADMLGDVILNYVQALPQGEYKESVENHWQVIGCGGRI